MKKILTMAIAIILATTTVFANNDKPARQKQSYQLSFNSLQVADGIDLVLVESADKQIELEGTDADISKVEWKIKNNVMYISSKKGHLKGKVKLVVNVNELKEIFIKGNSAIRSYGELNSPSLTITLDSGSFVSVISTGNIQILHDEGTELEVTKVYGAVKFGS